MTKNFQIGLKVMLARRQCGLTQEDLAKLIHCTQPTVSEIERGVIDITFSRIMEIARATGQPLNYFSQGLAFREDDILNLQEL